MHPALLEKSEHANFNKSKLVKWETFNCFQEYI